MGGKDKYYYSKGIYLFCFSNHLPSKYNKVVGDLAQTQIMDDEQGVGLLYKLMKVSSISVFSTMSVNDEPVSIFHVATSFLVFFGSIFHNRANIMV